MPEPDFDQIARRVVDETGVGRLEEWDAGDPERVVTAIAEQLRQVWNARGDADLAAFQALEARIAHLERLARRVVADA